MLDLVIALFICGTVALAITPWQANSPRMKQIRIRDPIEHAKSIQQQREQEETLSIAFPSREEQFRIVPFNNNNNNALVPLQVHTAPKGTNYLFKLINDSAFMNWMYRFVRTIARVRRERQQQQQQQQVKKNQYLSIDNSGYPLT